MKLRNMVIVAGLATLAGGCAVEPSQQDERGYEHDRRIYRESDSYQGYYYVRIIYINGDPWYVDDYRRVRPIPRNLHSHFQYSTWTRSLPPRFGSDREVRDGYDISRIVYINDVPHYVDDDRRARPVPDRVRSRFEYRVVVPQQGGDRRGDERRGDERPQPVQRYDDRRGDDRQQPPQRYDDREARPVPPASRRDERSVPAAQVREQPPERGAGRDEGRSMPQDKGRNGNDEQRGALSQSPAGIDQDRGKSQAVSQPAGDDRKSRAGSAKGDEQRTDAAAEKKNERAKGRGKDREEDEREDWRDRDARKVRGE